MTCTEIEVLLADYLDGTLAAEEKSAVEVHLRECAACAEFAQDIQAAMGFMERAAEVAPPSELLTRIAHSIPQGKHHSVPLAGWKKLFGRYLQPVLQPRFAMGMAMTILSFSMLGRFAGIEPRQLKPSDLNPIKVWQAVDDRGHRAWDQAVKYYDSIRLVYEIRSRLREWNDAEEADRKSAGQTKANPAPAQSSVDAAPGAVPPATAAPSSDKGRTLQK